ncbi:TolC family protein [Caviibacter abscessus]|uniref:TolC family protein n=1 Tax=Caviibacter abscessus TaxID=1766719 RepID=UPI0008337F12|nr:TolC family protein [Caviibacter abscessus]
MKKYQLFILLLIGLNSFSINALKSNTYNNKINELNNIKNKKIIASVLDDFKYVTNDLGYNYDSSSKHNLKNTLKWGAFTYTITYGNGNGNNGSSNGKVSNSIGVSKDLNDFFYNKWDLNKQLAISEYNKNYDAIKNEYFSLVDLYADLLVKKGEYDNSKSVLDKLNSDEKIIETKYKSGSVSKIDYENFKLQIEIKKHEIIILQEELNKILNQLKAKNVSIDINNLEDFEIKEIKIKDQTNELKNKIKVEKRIAELQYNKYIASKVVPTINVNAMYNIENKSYSVGLNVFKSFDLTGVDLDEAKYNKKHSIIEYDNKLKAVDNKYNDDLSEYALLKNTYKLELSKEQLAKKELEIANLKYRLGSIKYNDLLKAINEYHSSKLNTIKAKSKLGAFILKKEI